jgi:hypothetical protein
LDFDQHRYVVLDRYTKFSQEVLNFLDSSSIQAVGTSVRRRWQNGLAEPLSGSERRDCFDRVIALDEAHSKCRAMTLTTEEFLRRFLQHVLPKGLPRIRYFGWLAKPPLRPSGERLIASRPPCFQSELPCSPARTNSATQPFTPPQARGRTWPQGRQGPRRPAARGTEPHRQAGRSAEAAALPLRRDDDRACR